MYIDLINTLDILHVKNDPSFFSYAIYSCFKIHHSSPSQKYQTNNHFCIHTMDNTLNDCSKTENFAFSHGQKRIPMERISHMHIK